MQTGGELEGVRDLSEEPDPLQSWLMERGFGVLVLRVEPRDG